MTTDERELTEPVALCVEDGSALNPRARGWSRRSLHRANLHGCFGTNKRWDYWAVLAGDLVISAVYSDIDHFGLADVYWADLVSGETGGKAILVPADAVALPEVPGTAPLLVHRDGLDLAITDSEQGTTLRASWTEPDGRLGRLDLVVELPAGHESLNVVIPWNDRQFNFTSKHQARPVVGELVVGDRQWVVGGDGPSTAWGVLDVGRGRWPSEIAWNWGGGAGRVDDHVVGLQFGAKWTEGSGFTENGLIVDGRLSKIGRELGWQYEWDEPMAPWRVVDPGGQLDVTLTPRFDKHSAVDGGEFGSETHQVFGTWSGRLRTDDGLELSFEGIQGFAEEARQRW
ncbi:MAG: DUF2804 domain-containing protein [Acidimicrobiia bacterium]|nr:DUF2804 domain-containing protein [Acidimicrobiia bacterium]